MLPLIVFDVNETLLDLGGLDAPFAALLGTDEARRAWFAEMLALSLTANVVDDYADFTVLARRALVTTGDRYGYRVGPDDIAAIVEAMRSLEPHPDVVPALEELRDAGFRLATLTNSPPATVEAQLANAGLRPFFEAVLSVDAVRRFKPAPETYRYAARALDVALDECVLVAAHGWDVYGAMRAGMRAAFVARPGHHVIPEVPAPSIVGGTLGAIAATLRAGRTAPV
jgi:2-haloacid dehalogenase